MAYQVDLNPRDEEYLSVDCGVTFENKPNCYAAKKDAIKAIQLRAHTNLAHAISVMVQIAQFDHNLSHYIIDTIVTNFNERTTEPESVTLNFFWHGRYEVCNLEVFDALDKLGYYIRKYENIYVVSNYDKNCSYDDKKEVLVILE